jgi:chromosome partitioning protein
MKVISLINMKGGVGKTTLTFNLGWYAARLENSTFKVLLIDLDPQANLSQYFIGPVGYLNYINSNRGTVIDIFTNTYSNPLDIIRKSFQWGQGSKLDIISSKLELSAVLRNSSTKEIALSQYLSQIDGLYDLVLIDCAPTESILTSAAYCASRYIVVPVKPEFLAAIGFPLLTRSLMEHKQKYPNQIMEIIGVLFNDMVRSKTPPEQIESCDNVRQYAARNNWPVFENIAYSSASYPAGSRESTPIFNTPHARDYVKGEFFEVGYEFLRMIGLV